MKYVRQFGVILLLSFIGEILHVVLPFPIPASIYGILLLFFCLEWKLIPVSAVKETSVFLIEIMPVMFIPAAVGLTKSWDMIKQDFVPYCVITVLTTFIVMAVSGKVVQWMICHTRQRGNNKHERDF